MTGADSRRLRPSGTVHRDVLQVRLQPGRHRPGHAPRPGEECLPAAPESLLADAWSCVETFAGADTVLLGAGGAAHGDGGAAGEDEGPAGAEALVADGLLAATQVAGVVVLVTRGRPSAFAAAAGRDRLRVVLVDDSAEGPAGLKPWTDTLDGHVVVVGERAQLVGAVCEALVHEGPALVQVTAGGAPPRGQVLPPAAQPG